ncbi:28893_t:CDS:2 [Racocetra persica]|uniref:28893_t:CDS:1 n=1 Tax=Racocetra persica TaxID=160502 RepID=A0ACA9L1Q4_9GLOM|nr:28893_t:CDS:2 [Racocetra persica]
MVLDDCCRIDINKIWEVKHVQSTMNHSQFVLLLEDKSLKIFDKSQKSSVLQNKNYLIPTSTFQVLERIYKQEIDIRNLTGLDSNKVLYGCGLGLYKKALNIAIINSSKNVLESIL